MDFKIWQPYIISAVIGLLVGIEREKAHPKGSAIGVRTFLLVALSGAIAGGLENLWIGYILAAFALSLVVISYFLPGRNPRADIGLTTEFAAGIIFALSYISHSRPVLTSVMGPIVAMVLFSKPTLHRFTSRIKTSEFQAALLLLLVATTVVNMLEDRVIDPWGIFNPKKFGLLVLILGAMQFSSYVLAKFLGEKKSSLLMGFVGGLVSSTAVLLSSARESRKVKVAPVSAYMAVIASQLASLGQVLFIVALVSETMLIKLASSIAATLIVGCLALGAFSWRRSGGGESSAIPLRSPLDWWGTVRLAVLFAIMLGAVAIANRTFGSSGTTAVSILAGLFELHGMTLANVTMFARERMDLGTASENILFAISASFFAKALMCWIVARNRFAIVLTALFILFGATLWGTALLSNNINIF